MRKWVLLLLMAFISVSLAHAKSTLVPRYSSYISFSEQGDTIDGCSSRTTLYKDDTLGLFRVAVIHETLTKDRIKYIHRLETKLGLAMLSASLSAFSTISSDWKDRYMGRVGTYVNGTLADIYSHNLNTAKKLGIEAWVENTSSEEIMLADQERGLVWYLLPGQVMRFTMNNPDILMLRISTINNERRHYVTISAGSILREAQVEMETENEYVFPFVVADEDGNLEKSRYVIYEKATGEQRQISPSEYKVFKKLHK